MNPALMLLMRAKAAASDPLAAFSWAWRFESPSITGLADGAAVLTWPDTSGNDRPATRRAVGPVWDAAAFGGKGGVTVPYGSGAAGLVTGAITALNQPVTIWFVGNTSVASNTFMFDGIAAGNRLAAYTPAGTGAPVIMYAGENTSASLTQGNAVWALTFNGASSKVWKGGGAGVSTLGTVGTHSLTGLTIGAHFTQAGLGCGAPIGAIMVANAAQTPAQMNVIGAALATKYSLKWTDIT